MRVPRAGAEDIGCVPPTLSHLGPLYPLPEACSSGRVAARDVKPPGPSGEC